MINFYNYVSGFIKRHSGRIYIVTRSLHGLWSMLVCPVALWFFTKTGGSESVAVLDTVAWLYAMTVIIHLEQFLYPANLAGSIRLTGVIYVNIFYSMLMNDSYGIYFGFYTTFLTAMAFVCLTVIVLIISLFFSGWIRLPFFNSRIDSFKERMMFIGTVALIGSPFFYGIADFSEPAYALIFQQEYPYINLMLVGAQLAGTFIQFIRLMFNPDNEYTITQKKHYDETWYPVSNMLFFISMIISFIVLF